MTKYAITQGVSISSKTFPLTVFPPTSARALFKFSMLLGGRAFKGGPFLKVGAF